MRERLEGEVVGLRERLHSEEAAVRIGVRGVEGSSKEAQIQALRAQAHQLSEAESKKDWA